MDGPAPGRALGEPSFAQVSDTTLSVRMSQLLRWGKLPNGKKVDVPKDRSLLVEHISEQLRAHYDQILHVAAASCHEDGSLRFIHYTVNGGHDVVGAAPRANEDEHGRVPRKHR
jgi:hypothetical protein